MSMSATRQSTVARRYSAWLDLVSDLLRTTRTFPIDVLLAELARTFHGRTIWAWRDPEGSVGFRFDRPVAGVPTRGSHELWSPTPGQGHPLLTWYLATGDPTAMTAARAHRQLHHPGELPSAQQLAIPCRLSGPFYRTMLVCRHGVDFTDDELALARRIQPLLALLDCHFQEHAEVDGEGIPSLTEREQSVLDLLCEGCTATAIAHRLGISPRTVHVHLQNAYRKLGVSDRLLAVRAYTELVSRAASTGV